MYFCEIQLDNTRVLFTQSRDRFLTSVYTNVANLYNNHNFLRIERNKHMFHVEMNSNLWYPHRKWMPVDVPFDAISQKNYKGNAKDLVGNVKTKRSN